LENKTMSTAVFLLLLGAFPAADCNRNGVDDAEELEPGPIVFDTAPVHSVPSALGATVLADLDGDGKPDVAGIVGRSLTILRGNGDGSFQPAKEYEIGVGISPSTDLLAADLDGDGDLDLAFGDRRSRLWVLLNAGDGSFDRPVESPLSGTAQRLVAADLDGGGQPELVAAYHDSVDGVSSSALAVLGGMQAGAFGEVERQPLPAGSFPSALTVTDVDGDEKLDVIVSLTGSAGRSDSIFYNRGDGTLEDGLPLASGSFGAFADFNGDGVLDLAVFGFDASCECYRGSISVLLNAGDRSFTPAGTYRTHAGNRSLLAADLNGDHRPDLVAFNGDSNDLGSVSVLLNDGRGGFGEAVDYLETHLRVTLLARDLDGDQDLDLLVHHGKVTVLFNDGKGTFARRMSYVAGRLLGLIDLDGDGDLDLLFQWGWDLWVGLNGGSGEFAASRIHDLPGGSGGDVLSADFNGDGRPDLAAQRSSGVSGIAVLLGREDGELDIQWQPTPVGYQYFAAADLNGNGKVDLAAGGWENGVAVFAGRGDGSFEPEYFTGGSRAVGRLAVGDVDGDGDIDLVSHVATQEQLLLKLLLNDGSGLFERLDLTLDLTLDTVPHGDILLADLDGDGRADIAVPTRGGFSVYTRLLDGEDPEGGAMHHTVEGGRARSLAAADFDGDGSLDIVLLSVPDTHGDEVSMSLFLNDGSGTFPGPITHGIGFRDVFFAAGAGQDLDQDGRPDLVAFFNWCRWGRECNWEGRFAVFRNLGGGSFETPVLTSASAPYFTMRFALADLDGDGTIDLASGNAFGVAVHRNLTRPPLGLDRNLNGIPDDCERPFHRGDPDGSGTSDISDAITIFGFLFLGDPRTLACRESADSNNDGKIDITDGIQLLGWLFQDGPEPAAPGPPGGPCGLDPDPPGSAGDLGCADYAGCKG
jgi:hypothetical protein